MVSLFGSSENESEESDVKSNTSSVIDHEEMQESLTHTVAIVLAVGEIIDPKSYSIHSQKNSRTS